MPSSLPDLNGKVALVTGAASGIGRGLALKMAECGAGVVVTDIKLAGAQAVAEEAAHSGADSLCLGLDVTDPVAVEEVTAEAIATMGQIDFLFANAGILGPGRMEDLKPEDWHRVLDINLRGVIHCCQAVMPHLIKREQGRIVVTSSINGLRAAAHVAPYRVSKAGTLMYVRCLALALAPHNVTVNAICPGVTLTPVQMDYMEKTAAQQGTTVDEYKINRLARNPMGRFTEVDDLASLAAYLVSDAADMITGQAIAVDGGEVVG